MTSGSVDIKSMLIWLQAKSWLSANATLGQICYGVEVVSTNKIDATFTFSDFSILDS